MRVSLYDLASVDSWEENSVLEIIAFHCQSPVSLLHPRGGGVRRGPGRAPCKVHSSGLPAGPPLPFNRTVGVWPHVCTRPLGTRSLHTGRSHPTQGSHRGPGGYHWGPLC